MANRSSQANMFQEANQKYCIDACAVLDFWGSVDLFRRPYDIRVQGFRKLWDHIANQIDEGYIVLPYPIYEELRKTSKPELKKWLDARKSLFPRYDTAQNELAEIVNKFHIYTTEKGSLNDAILVAIAKQRGLQVITSEKKDKITNPTAPKVPNVGEEVGVKCKSLPEYFEENGL